MILVTGGAGYIGSHTCVELLNAGKEIVVLDNFSNSSRDVPEKIARITKKEFDTIEGDVCDPETVRKLFSDYPIDAVIHFAGLKAVGESVEKPLLYYRENLSGAVNLLECMRDFGVKRFIFSSSATVYAADNPMPLTEESRLGCTNPYGWTKFMIERILEGACKADPGFSAVALRYFNPIGAHESGLIGEDPKGIPNNLLPYVARVAAGKLDCLSVFGDDYDTPDGTGVRDYIHVCDLARGHLLALDYAFGRTGIDFINLGTGKGTSVLEIVRAYEEASGKKVPYRIAPRRAGDIATCYADTEKAKRVLGFCAQYGILDMCYSAYRFTEGTDD